MITTAGQEGGQGLSAERSIGAPNGMFVANCLTRHNRSPKCGDKSDNPKTPFPTMH